MEQNIEEDAIILNNAAVGNRKSVIFASDGGAWIPVLTDFNITMPFTEFSSETTHANYKGYVEVLEEDYSCEDIDYFLENDINYYYHGSRGVFGGQINPDSESVHFLLIYSSQSARVFEILPCE
jgi:hypothetical protein